MQYRKAICENRKQSVSLLSTICRDTSQEVGIMTSLEADLQIIPPATIKPHTHNRQAHTINTEKTCYVVISAMMLITSIGTVNALGYLTSDFCRQLLQKIVHHEERDPEKSSPAHKQERDLHWLHFQSLVA
jgi:hypothetical protein